MSVSNLPVELDQIITESAIIALIEDYGKWLIKHSNPESIEQVKEKLCAIVSMAMDRGDLDQIAMAQVNNWASEVTLCTDYTRKAVYNVKRTEHALVEELQEVITVREFPMDKYDPEVAQMLASYRAFKNMKNAILVKYANLVEEKIAAFVTSYSKMFEEPFVACIGSIN